MAKDTKDGGTRQGLRARLRSGGMGALFRSSQAASQEPEKALSAADAADEPPPGLVAQNDVSGEEVEVKIYDQVNGDDNPQQPPAGSTYTEMVSLAMMGSSHLDPMKASFASSFGSNCDPLKASFGSDVTDFDNLHCPGAKAEMDEHYFRNVYGLSEEDAPEMDPMQPMYCSPLPSFKSDKGPTSFKSDKGPTSFNEPTSFGSNVTDFDNVTCPGAQAEHDENYVRACFPAGLAAVPECGLAAVPEGSAPMSGAPPLPSQFPYHAPWALDPTFAANPYLGGQDMSAAQLSAQAASLDFQAAQLREAARQAEEAARLARCQVSSSLDPQLGIDPHAVPGKASSSGGKGTSRMWNKAEPNSKGIVGKSLQYANASSVDVADEQNTTLMLRNLPNDYKRDMLLELLDENGFKGKYNFVYLPMDFKRWAGLGYAFVNMVAHEDAVEMLEKLNGFTDWKKASQKICEVTWGDQGQGLDAHIQRYRNSPVMHPEWSEEAKPLLFHNGERVAFPPPTKKLRPPRVKR